MDPYKKYPLKVSSVEMRIHRFRKSQINKTNFYYTIA
jgi:hypothetical protein